MIDFNQLPKDLQNTISKYIEAKETNDSLVDCYLTEMICAINGYVRIGKITKEEGDELKERYS